MIPFKLFNDNYGHQEGDKCLYAVAQAVASVPKRSADLVARYGGEEIVLALPNTTAEGAFTVAEIIRKKIENLKIPHAHSKASPYVTLSLGVSSVIPNNAFFLQTLLRRLIMLYMMQRNKDEIELFLIYVLGILDPFLNFSRCPKVYSYY